MRFTIIVMFVCASCGIVELSLGKFRAHLQRHRNIGELKFPLVCSECKSSFSTIYNYVRHLGSYHSSTTENNVDADCVPIGCSHAADVDVDEDPRENNAASDLFQDVRSEGVALVAGLRANSGVPYVVIPNVVDYFNSMSSSLTSLIKTQTVNCLRSCGLMADTVEAVEMQLDTTLQKCSTPLDFLDTRYKQDKYFDNHPLSAKPESVTLGTSLTAHSGKSTLTYESYQYVPVEKTLRCLLQNREYVQLLLNDKTNSDVFKHYTDGKQCKTHPLFSDSKKLSIMIQFFYDGLGVTNPLRGQSTLHNVGVFFYTIKNLSEQYNSCFSNVHLLALCYSLDIKKYGFDPILEKFVCEMNKLSRHGFQGNFPVIGQCTVFASLCQVTCDNLALNGIFGFIESFACDYFCTLCYATQEQIQQYFSEDLFEMRTKSSYNADLGALTKRTGKKMHVRGIKRYCKLNDIDGFHVTTNFSLDIMHIVLEGIIPYELGCVLCGLCAQDGLTVDVINNEIQLFWGKITVEKGNRPLELNKFDQSGGGISPSMKAVQYWALLKYLPLILGCFVSPKSNHWRFLLHLEHLVDLIFAPKFTPSMTSYLKSVTADHLAMFVDLYGCESVRLRPKHHLLVHLPTIILMSGPLTGMGCLRYELKNSFFKRSAHIACNFTNICQTLAYRHQQHALFSLLSGHNMRNTVLATSQSTMPVWMTSCSALLCYKLGLQGVDDVFTTSKLSVGSLEYKKGHFLIIDEQADTGLLQFGEICSFVSHVSNEVWYVIVKCFKTVEFCGHLHSYCISALAPDKYAILTLAGLVDHRPLYCHQCSFPDGMVQKYIRLPYHVFKM